MLESRRPIPDSFPNAMYQVDRPLIASCRDCSYAIRTSPEGFYFILFFSIYTIVVIPHVSSPGTPTTTPVLFSYHALVAPGDAMHCLALSHRLLHLHSSSLSVAEGTQQDKID